MSKPPSASPTLPTRQGRVNAASVPPAGQPQSEQKEAVVPIKKKGGRPKKQATQVRKHKYTVFLSEAEKTQLERMMEETGKVEADLFRHSLLGKRLAIPKARAVPAELWDTLVAFKRLASLHQYLATKEKEFSAREREQLLGSSHSLRATIERLQRSVFVSLDKADELSALREVIDTLSSTMGILGEKEQWAKAERAALGKALGRAEQLLTLFYHHLKL